ncbi:PREDICTED: PDZ and LIM domain protein Zasp isoform X8 [Bactrocera latifrons]|uniref:PDZ and LIM domain protein Zasp isoform X8 n=1 Tax=Bactrocera latifrons TaxID=174628 RepID=UPI0008DE8DC1|nr:PREDICTED: PDZ and LIM domain protein Zasp isoform X8 [Bactrocera latifrons]
MAQPQLLQIKLSRFDAQPWGFRLQGGVDFATPLVVQKVNGGSLAEKAGLIPGDAVLRINDVDVFNLRHKDAQDVVVRSGNNFVLTVQRGGSTWRPHVTPTGNIPQPQQNSPYLQTVTKTSLAHKQQESQHIGCGYNNAARPFANGGDGNVKSIVNKQYNTPVGIYSDESIAETLSAQAEVLAGGVLGVNFKKNEKEYQPDKSEVLKFLREEETDASTPEPPVPANFYWTQSHAIGGNERRTPLSHKHQHLLQEEQPQDESIGTNLQENKIAPSSAQRPSFAQSAKPSSSEPADPRVIIMPVCPALQGPEYKAEMEAAAAALQHDDGPRPFSASGHPACALCGVGIVGVFVRIKDKNLHVECFKCATCGTSLKNQGYYNYNNKLYCDIHAKLAALQNPPPGTDGYVPVPIKPNTKLSANTISSALNAHGFSEIPVANGGSVAPPTAPQVAKPAETLDPPPPVTPDSLSTSQASTAISSTIANSTLLNTTNNINSSNNNKESEQLEGATQSIHGKSTNFSSGMLANPSSALDTSSNKQPFGEYVTLTGSVIRSVVPPGKGVNINYKVNQGYARPFGAAPAVAPKSPVAYPPQRPAINPYATLPRTNVGQQVQAMSNTTSTSTYDSNSTHALRSSYQNNTRTVKSDVKVDLHEVIEETTEELEHSDVLFPPPSPLSHLHGKSASSGLHKADTIPKYQRNWTVLPNQSPARTPEPPELRENIPLAFVDAPVTSSSSNPVHKPVAQSCTTIAVSQQYQQQHEKISSANRGSIKSTSSKSSSQEQSKLLIQNKKPIVPIIIEEKIAPQVTMAFQSLDEHLQTDESQTLSRPYTPSISSKPVPVIPYYQTPEALCFDECPATHARNYDRRSASPFPDRARSPAPGPPTNPLAAIRSPKPIDNKISSLSPLILQAGSITTGQSYLGAQQQLQQQQQQQTQILSHYEQAISTGSQSCINKPGTIKTCEIGDYKVQSTEKEVQKVHQNQSKLDSQTKIQIGDTQIESRRRVTEEYEHTQSARSVEIRTDSKTIKSSPASERRQSYGKTGYVANQARRLSGLEQEITNLTSQSQAISARAATLTETSFPQIKSPEPSSKFPTKPVLPPHDEPQRPNYLFSATPYNKMVGPPPGFSEQQQQLSPAIHLSSAYGSSVVSQQQQSLSTYSSSNFTSSTSKTSSLSSQANATNVGSLTKASITNNNIAGAASARTTGASAVCPVTGTFCRPGHTCCRQQQLQTQSSATDVVNYNQNNNLTYRTNASTGLTDIKTNAQATAIATANAANAIDTGASQAPHTATAAAATATATTSFPPPNTVDKNKSNAGLDGLTGVGGKGAFGATSAPKRGRGIFNKAVGPGVRVPLCSSCNIQIRGPFITALGRIWCPEHFICVNANCRRPLQDIGFVEEKGDLYCEYCFEKYLAPTCSKCGSKIKGDCLNAIGKQFHPECFTCGHCGKLFGNTPFFLEDGNAYCEADWNELFTTKCFACGFPVEAGDRWVEALNHNYHSQCFNCTYCKQNLEGQSFYNKGGRPFCKNHAR